jgi:hypothetical protein
MRRVLAAVALSAAAVAMPAYATGVPLPGGTCDDPVDVVCAQPPPCNGEDPCDPVPCTVWLDGTCRF